MSSLVALLTLVFVASAHAQYLQVYPGPDANNNGTVPLYFGLMMSFKGDYVSSGGVPGVQVALDQINDDSTMLPGYTLHYTLTDSRCNRTVALNQLFYQFNDEPTKIAWLGSGCSVATDPTAEISHYYNITQVSCESSSSGLADRIRFQKYFQLLVTDDIHALGFFGIIKRYEWLRVVILEQDESLFTVTTGRLTDLLNRADIDYIVHRFQTNDGIETLGDNPFDEEARIYVLLMYEPHAKALLCKAYQYEVLYPRYLILTLAWYSNQWWTKPSDDYDLSGCTPAQRERVLQYSLGALEFDFISNYSIVADTGINGTQFEEEYNRRINESDLEFVSDPYGQDCYDAMWTLAYALNNTIADLAANETLNDLTRVASGLPEGTSFSMENFTYSNNFVAELMFRHMKETDFIGITRRVKFNDAGIREDSSVKIYQYRKSEEAVLGLVEVGRIVEEDGNVTFEFIEGESDETIWKDNLIPYDGIPIEEDVTVALSLTVIYVLLASAGVVLTIACLIFNFVFRKRKLVRLSSPNLNCIIGLGALILYIDVYLTVVPTTDSNAVSILCNITPWLTSLGYSLIFGTILAKMARVYHIFNNPTSKKVKIQDWQLFVVVLVLVVIDLIILGTYTGIEGRKDNLSATRLVNKENPEDEKGDLGVVYKYYFYTCTSEARSITLGVLYGYKAVLQVVSLLFAFQIRKVKVKGLNDAKYIAAAIYVTSIILVVTILSTYTLVDYVNGYVAVFGLGVLVGTTAIVALVFLPKMAALHRDPNGETIFLKSMHVSDEALRRSSVQLEKINVLGENSCDLKETIDSLRKRNEQLEKLLVQYEQQLSSTCATSPKPDAASYRTSKVSFSVSPMDLKNNSLLYPATPSFGPPVNVFDSALSKSHE